MKRRALGVVAAGAAFWPILANAQPEQRVYRVGMLRPTPQFDNSLITTALRQLGYVDGRNLILDTRFAEGDLSTLPTLARGLVQSKPDVILTVGSAATRAAQDATTTVPIIFFGNFDPIAAGHVASLARPGGNLTGMLIASEGTFAGKKLELLKEAVPHARRVAILVPDDPNARFQVEEARKLAPSLGVTLTVVDVRNGKYDEAFERIVATQSDALFIAAHTYFVRDRKVIIELAARHRLPAIYEWPYQAKDGGLMAYGPNQEEFYAKVATYIARILKGAKPGDLPVELPTKLELVINLKTAKALGLTISPTMLARADEVIE